jgi:hypothetical protein
VPIDYGQLFGSGDAETLIEPKEIFASLSGKLQKFSYLRDVQGEVLSGWFDRRNEPDVVIKMNTGGGKTTVGLLILQSCLNEGRGPVLYLAPDEYLAKQAAEEAKDLGIRTANGHDDAAFLSGQAIFVTNVKKLINGLSVFGVKPGGTRIKLGSILIDDAHACLALAEEQFTVRIESKTPLYKSLLELFSDSLRQQSEAYFLDLKDGRPGSVMLVPYWSWLDKFQQVNQLLQPLASDDQLKFHYPLIRGDLQQCRAVFGTRYLEISPQVLPIDAIPAFGDAARRIYMTATLADDSILVSDFAANKDSVSKPISPKSASDIGDRMVLIPQEANPRISDEEVQEAVCELAKRHNTVVIVPSTRRAKFWEGKYKRLLSAESLHEGVQQLHKGYVGLVVLLNKYDGVDLPSDACRILVIDGVPDARRLSDQYEESVLSGSALIKARRVQRIEQGMGRGVRSSDDYCVVVLMGSGTITYLYPVADRKVSPATKMQFDLWEKLKIQLAERASASDVLENADACLKRDAQWVQGTKLALARVKYAQSSTVSHFAVLQRDAFGLGQIGQYRRAAEKLQEAVNQASETKLKGLFKQQLAEMTYHFDKTAAQEIQLSAVEMNRSLLKPLEGILHEKLKPSALTQAAQIRACLLDKYGDKNGAVIGLNALADALIYQPDRHEEFEAAFSALGEHLGFKASRPEKEHHQRGPDELWAMGGASFLLCECKSEIGGDRINKHDCDQLNGAINWFHDVYGHDLKLTPVMAHRSHCFEYACSPHEDIRIIDDEMRFKLQASIREYAAKIGSFVNLDDPTPLTALVQNLGFTGDEFALRYTRSFTRKR